jgi:hypothetical protein
MDRNRPKIGITTSPRRGAEYYDTYKRAVEAAGAEVVDLPPGTSAIGDLDGLPAAGRLGRHPLPPWRETDSKVGDIDPS